MRRREPIPQISLAGHPQKMPSHAWRKLFEQRMDDWLKARGHRNYALRDLIKASVGESQQKRETKEKK